MFLGPGQVAGVSSNGETYQPKGYALVFHPDLIHGTSLGRHMPDYTFFGYQSNEALHLSKRERDTVMDCLSKIDYELEQAIDKHSKRLIVSTIELFLNYCSRFYDRQFITRNHAGSGILERFETLLNSFFPNRQTAGNRTAVGCVLRRGASPVSQLFRRFDKKGDGQDGPGIYSGPS